MPAYLSTIWLIPSRKILSWSRSSENISCTDLSHGNGSDMVLIELPWCTVKCTYPIMWALGQARELGPTSIQMCNAMTLAYGGWSFDEESGAIPPWRTLQYNAEFVILEQSQEMANTKPTYSYHYVKIDPLYVECQQDSLGMHQNLKKCSTQYHERMSNDYNFEKQFGKAILSRKHM